MQKESQRHNDEGRAKTSLATYVPLFIVRFACERQLETEQRLQYIDPPLLWPSSLCLSRSPGLLNRRPRGPLCWVRAFSTASCLQLLWSPTCLISNSIRGPQGPFGRVWLSLPHLVFNSSDRQLTDFLSPPSYIIVQLPTQSPTQSLEWHVWSSSSGNNWEVTLFRCISMSVSWAFTLSHFVSQIRVRDFFRLLAIGMCHFLPVYHFEMAYLAGSKVNIQHYAVVLRLCWVYLLVSLCHWRSRHR